VSLLAGARGQRILPEIGTVQDLKLAESPGVLNDEIEELIQKSLARLGSNTYVLNVYFGNSPYVRHEKLARALFNLFPAPLLQASFVWRGDQWRVDTLGPIALGERRAANAIPRATTWRFSLTKTKKSRPRTPRR
jgi:hypothetical protein